MKIKDTIYLIYIKDKLYVADMSLTECYSCSINTDKDMVWSKGIVSYTYYLDKEKSQISSITSSGLKDIDFIIEYILVKKIKKEIHVCPNDDLDRRKKVRFILTIKDKVKVPEQAKLKLQTMAFESVFKNG